LQTKLVMLPTSLSAVPSALPSAEARDILDLPVEDFLATGGLPEDLVRAVKAVVMIRRIDCVGGLCDKEVEGLLTNRYSADAARVVCARLWQWLLSFADIYTKDEEDSDKDVGDLDPDDDDDEIFSRAHPEGSRVLPPTPYQSLPAIEAPPQNGELLDLWAVRYGVGDRLADRIPIEPLLHRYYGLRPDGLPATIREAVLLKAGQIRGSAYLQGNVASQLVSSAKAHLHRAAQAVAIIRRRQDEHTARKRRPDDPFLLRLLDTVQRQRDSLAVDAKPRPLGLYLPGRIYVDPGMPKLIYWEWQIQDSRAPGTSDRAVLDILLSTWDSDSLHFRCLQCREPLRCPHALTALDRLIVLLSDPEDALADALIPVLRVPSWSRLLDHLDGHLAKVVPAADETQRLVWEISDGPLEKTLLPVLQRLSKRGTWSRGQRLRLEDLDRQPHLLRDTADQAAFEALTSGRRGYSFGLPSQSPRELWRALAALVGTPRVYADPMRSVAVSVRKVRPVLRVDSVEGGFRLRFLLGPTEVEPETLLDATKDGRHVVWVDAEHNRCLLALVDTDVVALISAMARYPITLPGEAVNELVGRLPRMQGTMDLHLPEDVRGQRVEPPTTIVCRIEPAVDEGIRIAMVVRPIADGPVFPPGEGPPEILHAREGRRLHAVRALGAERERAAHLQQVLGIDDSNTSGDWRWDISEDAVALDLLGKLRGLSELAEVEWPAGEIRVDSVFRVALKVQVRKRRDWFGAEGGVEIDGARVSLAQLLAAIRAGRRYVKLGARRFAAIEDDLRDRLAALDDVVFENQGAIELGLLAAPVLADLVENARQLDLEPAFRATLGKLEAARVAEVALPDGLQTTLRHYQDDGFRWMARLSAWGLGACLADDMGLGKTVQALALLLQRAQRGPALVVAPTSVVSNWVAECTKFAPGLRPQIYRGPDRAAVLSELGKGSLLITSYAIAVRDAQALSAIAFSTLIVDEAQSVKNALTQRFRAIRDLQADFRVALTGTPIENHLGELWAIFRLVTPGLLGPWEQFRQRFAVPIERHHDRARQSALARVVRPFILRRTKREVAPELPSRTEMNQSIDLSPAERRLYEAARIDVLESLAKSAGAGGGEEARQRIKILAALTRLRLLCCHPRLVVEGSTAGSAKLAALVDLLTELRDEGHRALVFSQFTSFLDLARPLLAESGLRTLTLDGSTPAAVRDERVRAFQAGEADVFLLSLRAGGTGLNLTAATYVIHLDPWWNPAVEDQATDRAHRIGQERPVTVIRLVARGTIEEQVLALHEEKRQLAASVLDGADMAARLDGDELLDLIRRSGGPADTDEDEAADADAATTDPQASTDV